MIIIRSVFVLIDSNDRDPLIKALNSLELLCINVEDKQWMYLEQGEPVLYIVLDSEQNLLNDIEFNDNNYNMRKIIELYNVLQIDISGRHSGEKEVYYVVIELLSRFNGFALDDYSDHLWTIEDIKSDSQNYGYKFFDYRRH